MAAVSAVLEQPASDLSRRRMRWPGWLPYVLVPLLLDLAAGAVLLGQLRQGKLFNPDSYMRMARLREMMAAGKPVDVMYHGASGAGFVLHWSHLLDSLLCLLALPFQLVFSPDRALFAAALVVGPLEMVGLGLAVAWAAAPFVSRTRLWMVPLLCTLAPTITLYALPGVVHHHVLALIVAIMVGGWAARAILADMGGVVGDVAGAGWAIGAWTGAGVWLTPETLPLSAAGFGGLYVAWLIAAPRNRMAATLRDAGLGFLVTVAAALAVDPPFGGVTVPEVDRLSVVFLGVAAVAAILCCAIAAIDRHTARPSLRLLLSVGIGGLASGAWLAVFHAALFGPHALLDSAALQVMNGVISEMQPIVTWPGVAGYLFTGGVAAVTLALLAIRHRSLLLAYLALCALVLLGMGQQHVRFTCYPQALGAILIPFVLSWLDRPALAWPLAAKSAVRMTVMLACLLVPVLSQLWTLVPAAKPAGPAMPSCSVTELGPMLAPYAGRVVLTRVDEVPELLYRTRIDTVGSLYLRNAQAFMRLRAAWRSGPSAVVPPSFLAAHIQFVLFCKTRHRSGLVTDLPPDTLADRLNRGEVPPWLRQVAQDPASGNILYQVVR